MLFRRICASIIRLKVIAYAVNLAVAMAPSSVSARTFLQQEGFLVITVTNGPATLLINNRDRGQVSAAELTVPLPAGRHTIILRRQGFADFTRDIDIRTGDVTQLGVELVPAQVRVVEDDPTRGRATGLTTQLRVVHIVPAEVDIRLRGERLARTPATLELPVGRTTISVGSTELCLDLTTQPARVLLREGRLEQIEGARECRDESQIIVFVGLPNGFQISHGGRTLRPEVQSPMAIRVNLRGQQEFTLVHDDYAPVSVGLTLSEADSVEIEVDVGNPMPRVATRDTPLPQEPRDPNLSYSLLMGVKPAEPDLAGLNRSVQLVRSYPGPNARETIGKYMLYAGGISFLAGLAGISAADEDNQSPVANGMFAGGGGLILLAAAIALPGPNLHQRQRRFCNANGFVDLCLRELRSSLDAKSSEVEAASRRISAWRNDSTRATGALARDRERYERDMAQWRIDTAAVNLLRREESLLRARARQSVAQWRAEAETRRPPVIRRYKRAG